MPYQIKGWDYSYTEQYTEPGFYASREAAESQCRIREWVEEVSQNFHVIHEDFEDDEAPMVKSEKTYPFEEASEKANALAEKYPNLHVDICVADEEGQ